MPVQAANPFESFLAGRAARQDEDYANSRNALARMEIEEAPQRTAQRNKLAELQISGLEQNQAAAGQERKQQAYAQIGGLAQQALQSENPRDFVAAAVSNPAYAQLFQQAGIDPRQLDLNSPSFERDLQMWASIGPAPEQMTPYQQAQIDLERDKMNAPKTMSPYEQARIDLERQKLNRPDKSTGAFRPLTPKEVADAGLPEGTSAQVNERTGQINVLSKAPKPVASNEESADQKLDSAMNTLSAIRDVKDAIGWNTTGVGGQIFGSVAGTDAADMAANIDTIKANIGFDRLQMMRDASKTGGALGGIAVQELNMLQSTIASLNTKQSGPQLKKNIEKVEAQYTKAVNAYRKAMGLPPMADQATGSGTQAAPKRVKVDAQGNVIGN